MAEFIFVYRFPENYIGSPEAASLWESWFDALGTSLFDKGNPVFVRAYRRCGRRPAPRPGPRPRRQSRCR